MFTYGYMTGINPEPWKAPGAQVGRRGKQVFATLIKDGRLNAYQEAIREEMEEFDLAVYPDDQYLLLEMFLFRKLEEYTPTLGRKRKRKWADATNMGKALEDALQGVVYENDSKIIAPIPRIIGQSEDQEPGLMFAIQPCMPTERVLPLHDWDNLWRELRALSDGGEHFAVQLHTRLDA